MDGLKGAGVALLVLIASILACQGGYKFAHSSSTNWTDQKMKKEHESSLPLIGWRPHKNETFLLPGSVHPPTQSKVSRVAVIIPAVA